VQFGAPRLFLHGSILLFGLLLGGFFMMVDGFGCAVGDHPCSDSRVVWLKATAYVLLTVYAVFGLIWTADKLRG